MDINLWQSISSFRLIDFLIILGISIIFDTVYSFIFKVVVVLAQRITSAIKRKQEDRGAIKVNKEMKAIAKYIDDIRQKLAIEKDITISTNLEVEVSSLVLKLKSLQKEAHFLATTFQPKVSIIIPVHNGADVIGATLKSVLASDFNNREIIVVDDASTDDTYSEAGKFSTQINLIRREKSTGLKTGAINFGLNFCNADLVAVIDDDTSLEPNAITEMVKCFKNPEVNAATGNVRTKSDNRNIFTELQSIEFLDSMEIGRPFQNLLFKAPFVMSGCFSMFRKDVLHKIGAYDIDIITEDLDITWKLYRLKKRIAFVHKAICYTDVPTTIKNLRKQRFRWEAGFFQTIYKQRSLAFNKKYGRVGLLLLPETIIVEFLLLFLKPFYFIFLVILGYPILTIIVYMLIFYLMLQFFETLVAGLFSSKKSLALKCLWAPLLIIYRQYLALIKWQALYVLLRGKGVSW